MNGRIVAGGMVAVAALFGVGLWYAQTQAYYTPVEGLGTVAIAGVEVPVADYRGLDATSSPLKLRGCFTVDPALVQGPPAPDAAPLTTPGWFDCYDPAAIAAALASGQARAVIAAEDPPGFVRIVAVHQDGRAWQWRQSTVRE